MRTSTARSPFAIPSAVAGYAHMHGRWGVLAAIGDHRNRPGRWRKRGLSQDWFTTLKIANSASILRRYTESARIYLPNGLPPVPPYQGNARLLSAWGNSGRHARTRLAEAGLRDFYEGDVATHASPHDMAAAGRRPGPRTTCAAARPASPTPLGASHSPAVTTVQLAGGLTASPTLARQCWTPCWDDPHGNAA